MIKLQKYIADSSSDKTATDVNKSLLSGLSDQELIMTVSIPS